VQIFYIFVNKKRLVMFISSFFTKFNIFVMIVIVVCAIICQQLRKLFDIRSTIGELSKAGKWVL